MDVFEDLWTIASEEIRELNTLLREYKKEDFPSQLIEAEQSLTSIAKLVFLKYIPTKIKGDGTV